MSKASMIGLNVARQLVSRLCHDLVGPMGAVNNGLELVADTPDAIDDALGLVDLSARQLTARFTFLRAALGMGGVRNPSRPADLRATAELALTGNVSLEWHDDGAEDAAIDVEGAKLVLNMVLMAVESLPRGGVVDVVFQGADDGVRVEIAARGTGARPREDTLAALAEAVDEDSITARNVAAYVASRIGEAIGACLRVSESADGAVRFIATLR